MRLFLVAAVISGISAPQAIAQIETAEAEARILEACKAEQGTNSERCDCYVDELGTILPKETYRSMMTLAAAAMSNDTALMMRFIEESELDPDRFNDMLLEMEMALKTAETRCGQ